MVMLDASFLIDLELGNDGALAALHTLVEDERTIQVPAQAASEYLAGTEDPVANLHDLEESYMVLDHDRHHLLETARIAALTIAEGVFPGWTDTQIAAAAILHGEELLTADVRHFEALGCEVWAYREEARHPDG